MVLCSMFLFQPILLIDCDGRAFIDFSVIAVVANLVRQCAALKYVLTWSVSGVL